MCEQRQFNYRNLFENAQVGLAIVDHDGKWIEVNTQLCAITGYSRDELLSLNPRKLTHPEDREVDELFLHSLQSGVDGREVQKRCVHKRGHTIWLKISATPIYDSAGQVEFFLFTVNDISGLALTQETLHSALKATKTGIWEWDIQNNAVFWSDESVKLWGMKEGEFSNQLEQVRSPIHPDDVVRWENDVENCLQTGASHNTEFRLIHPDKSIHWIHAKGEVEHDSEGTPISMRGTVTDVTERVETKQRLAKIERHLRLAQQIAHVGSWVFNVQNDELYWSDEIYRIFGITPDTFDANMAAFMNTVHPEDRDYVENEYQASVAGSRDYNIEHRIIKKDTGEVRWVQERCAHERDEKGEVIRSDGVVQDITDKKLAEMEIQRLAMTDHLTGLANRRHFFRVFSQLLKLANREKMALSLMLLDLDGFKAVNDEYGHPIGDALLKAVSSRLKNCLRETDLLARLGGDEFAALLVNPEMAEGTQRTAERLVRSFTSRFELEGGTNVRVGISVGIASYPEQALTEEDLIKKADAALYKAKKSGGNTYQLAEYRPEGITQRESGEAD
ncbi:MAG: PAS domain-containing protein [Candidatus Thiodiazotropha taylori]|nr:PAS domain-containing protein [Candidatus Thiodiazotropha taylori]